MKFIFYTLRFIFEGYNDPGAEDMVNKVLRFILNIHVNIDTFTYKRGT